MEKTMKISKLLLIVGLSVGAALGSVASSKAADYYKTQPVRKQAFSWDGFYVGLTGGYGFGDVDYTGLGNAITVSPRGVTFGGVAGYNMQFASNLVLGIEADLNWANFDRTQGIVPGIGLQSGIDYFSTVRARAGYSMGTWMPYVTAGWAGAHLSSTVQGAPFSADDFVTGWVYGAGVEMAWTRNLSFNLEYVRLDLSGNQNFGVANTTADPKIDMIKAGLRYRFGG